ncbi:serine/threonine-protein kinase [Nonomuraea antri]|uniref:serine/threonine-protein kinase n=1 Tax=Nonomuraea antri TaxID=2730852 RepID=UPI001F21014C|nr:serine/threonine-protein kinase [Nonomuraea antri]
MDTRIGAGGMGEVWRGEDIVLARTVAVKVLLPGRMDDPGFVARFQGEARAMATINHAGVVDVYDYGVSGDTVYLVMKFVDGEPLDRLLARLGRIAPQPAMELIAQAASALQAVHDQGIVHRDVKPGNLLVQRDGTLVLTDFGIARSDLANRLTDAGMVLGTAAYCAPEQAEGAPVTPAVDIYALGVVAYECLVGQRPFDGDSPVTIALKHIREAPPPLPADIPQPVRALVERALSKDPLRRYPSARAMSDAAKAIVAGQVPVEPAQPMPALPPTTGAVMPPPAEAYPTGVQQAGVPQTGAHLPAGDQPTTVSERRPGSRRAAKTPRRTGLIAGIAAAVVLGVGAGAVALTGMTTGGAHPAPPSANAGNDGPSDPPTSPTKGGKPGTKTSTTKPPETRVTDRATTPPETEEPEPTKTDDPEETTSPTPTTTKPTDTKSPTPTVVKKKVPGVLNVPYFQARKIILAAGFTVKPVDGSQGTMPEECLIVDTTKPGPNELLELKKPVTLYLAPAPTCPSPTPTPTPSNSVKQ